MRSAPSARECLSAQTLTTAATTTSDDLTAVASGHAGAEAMGPLALDHTGLKGPLHGAHPRLKGLKQVPALTGTGLKRDADSRSDPGPCQSLAFFTWGNASLPVFEEEDRL